MTLQIEVALLVAFFSLLLGYAVGRRHGKEEGFSRGVNYAPLEMRRYSLEQGRCVVCGSPAKEDVRLPGGRSEVDGAPTNGPSDGNGNDVSEASGAAGGAENGGGQSTPSAAGGGAPAVSGGAESAAAQRLGHPKGPAAAGTKARKSKHVPGTEG